MIKKIYHRSLFVEMISIFGIIFAAIMAFENLNFLFFFPFCYFLLYSMHNIEFDDVKIEFNYLYRFKKETYYWNEIISIEPVHKITSSTNSLDFILKFKRKIKVISFPHYQDLKAFILKNTKIFKNKLIQIDTYSYWEAKKILDQIHF